MPREGDHPPLGSAQSTLNLDASIDFQSRTQSPQAFLSAVGRLERLSDTPALGQWNKREGSTRIRGH